MRVRSQLQPRVRAIAYGWLTWHLTCAPAVSSEPATTLAITPDGPHGPALVSKMGLAHLSRGSALPVVWVSARASWAVRLGTWDRMQLPLPGARVTVRISAPMFPGDWAAASLDEYREAIDRTGRDELARLDEEGAPPRPAAGR